MVTMQNIDLVCESSWNKRTVRASFTTTNSNMNYEQVELQDHIIGFDKLVIQAISERREISIDNIVKYGVPIIDEYLGGILPSELVVVAAET